MSDVDERESRERITRRVHRRFFYGVYVVITLLFMVGYTLIYLLYPYTVSDTGETLTIAQTSDWMPWFAVIIILMMPFPVFTAYFLYQERLERVLGEKRKNSELHVMALNKPKRKRRDSHYSAYFKDTGEFVPDDADK
jgi:hypothetical protein